MLVRSSDAPTSIAGADHIEPQLSELQAQFLSKLKELGKATSNEVAAELSTDFARRNTLRRRASDLVALGLIVERDSRVCSVSGRKATVYEVAPEREAGWLF